MRARASRPIAATDGCACGSDALARPKPMTSCSISTRRSTASAVSAQRRARRRRRRPRSRSSPRGCRRGCCRRSSASRTRVCFALALRLVVGRRPQRLVHEAVVEIVRQRSREDVRVLRRVRDAPSRNRLMHLGEVDRPPRRCGRRSGRQGARGGARCRPCRCGPLPSERDVLAGGNR